MPKSSLLRGRFNLLGDSWGINGVVSRQVVGEERGLGEVAGDFEAWVSPHLTVMRAIAIREVGRADADDLVQDALFRAWRKRATFRSGRGTPRTWLLAILFDQGRKHRRRTAHETTSLHDVNQPPARDPTDAARLDVEDAVRGLPTRQRQVISLFYLADLPMSAVASTLGISVGSVKTHLSLARNALSATLEHT
jgi:RNA polymerase sigma-70 factor (ECF subfamily)